MNLLGKVSYRLRHYVREVTSRIDDFFADRAIKPKLEGLWRSAFFSSVSPQRVLVLGVQSPRRPGSLAEIYDDMRSDHHQMTFDSKGVETFGKLDNINILLSKYNLADFDWVFMVDDDVELPPRFTDTLLALAEYAQLKIVGPAQRSHSYWSIDVTHRQKGVLVRETNFAEIGPIIAFRREVFDIVFPFPSLKYGWGVDMVMPVLAKKAGWKTGVADGAALRHTKPIGNTYDFRAAAQEAEDYMNRFGIYTGVHKLGTIETIRVIE